MLTAHNPFFYFLNELQDSGFDFYLTGSRFFGAAKRSSDYDFFTKYSQECSNWLDKLGFKPIERYGDQDDFAFDSNTELVMRYVNVAYGFQIDVQLVKDVDLKRAAQTHLVEVCKNVKTTKTKFRMSWEIAYAVLRSIK